MATILKSNPRLRRLLAMWAQSCIGTGAGYVALLLLTYRHLHSSWAISVVLLAEWIPAIVFGSWFGHLADRHSRRRLIVGANLLQAAAYGGLVFSHTAVPIVGLALVAGIGNSLQRPALRSSLPVVAGEDRQVAAAWYDACRWVGLTMGPLLAAGLFALSGVGIPLALNAVSFVIAAAAMVTLDVDGPAREPQSGGESSPGGLRAGLAAAFSAPAIATLVFCSAGVFVGGGLLNVCEPILATHVLHGSASDYAILVASYGIGMVIATALVARRGDKPAAVLIRRYLAAITLTALGMAGSAVSGSVVAAAVAFLATGYANALQLVSEAQLIQLRVANSVQGRLFGAKDTVIGVAFLTGLVGGGALVAAVGVRLTLGVGAAISGVCALVAVVSLRATRPGQVLDSRAPAPHPGSGAVESPAEAAPPLPVPAAAGELRPTA